METKGSYWWLVVALVPIYALFSLVVHRLPGLLPGSLLEAGGLPAVLFVLIIAPLVFGGMFLLPPLFPLALYLDARSIQDTAGSWNPNPLVYGGLGLPLLGIWGQVSPGTTEGPEQILYLFAVGVSLFYLSLRRRYTGIP